MRYSAGPNLIAKSARGWARKMMNTVAIMPPMKDAMPEMASAASGRFSLVARG